MPETVADIDTRLALIKTAIDGLITGKVQSTSVGGYSYSMLDIEKLEAMESRLISQKAGMNSTNRPGVVTFRKPG